MGENRYRAMGNSASEQKKLEQDIERVRQEMSAKYKVFLIGDAGIGKRVLLYKLLGDEDEAQKQSKIPYEPSAGTGLGGGIPLTMGNVEVSFCSAEHNPATQMIRAIDMCDSDILVVCVKDQGNAHPNACNEQIKASLQDYRECCNVTFADKGDKLVGVIIAYLNTPE